VHSVDKNERKLQSILPIIEVLKAGRGDSPMAKDEREYTADVRAARFPPASSDDWQAKVDAQYGWLDGACDVQKARRRAVAAQDQRSSGPRWSEQGPSIQRC
jgi:hypothetical protein